MYALNIEKETGRILSATYPQFAIDGMPLVETLPAGDISQYLFVDGQFVFSPQQMEGDTPPPTQLDLLEAQVVYTAMMTDTLLEDNNV